MTAHAHLIVWAALVLAPLVAFLAAIIGWYAGRHSARSAALTYPVPVDPPARPIDGRVARVAAVPGPRPAAAVAGRPAPVQIGRWTPAGHGDRS